MLLVVKTAADIALTAAPLVLVVKMNVVEAAVQAAVAVTKVTVTKATVTKLTVTCVQFLSMSAQSPFIAGTAASACTSSCQL
jgi:hypothetical protein